METDKEALCSTTPKNHRPITLEQPTKYNLDLEAGGNFSDVANENASVEGIEVDVANNEGENNGGSEGKSASTKIPPLYQLVEPGCTKLSCYSAILTFIVMTLGIFWILLTSPPNNSIPVPMPGSNDSSTEITNLISETMARVNDRSDYEDNGQSIVTN